MLLLFTIIHLLLKIKLLLILLQTTTKVAIFVLLFKAVVESTAKRRK